MTDGLNRHIVCSVTGFCIFDRFVITGSGGKSGFSFGHRFCILSESRIGPRNAVCGCPPDLSAGLACVRFDDDGLQKIATYP